MVDTERAPLCRASSELCSKDESGMRTAKMRESQRHTMHTGSQRVCVR